MGAKFTRKFSVREKNLCLSCGVDPDFLLAKICDTDIPIEYALSISEFSGNLFYVNPKVLIPRVETEYLVELVKDYIFKHKKSGFIEIIDVGTGSGCIAITLGLFLELNQIRYHITAIDISDEVLNVAKQNKCLLEKSYNTELSITFLKSNLLAEYDYCNIISKYEPKYKKSKLLVVANLPYVPTTRINELHESVREYEPRESIDGGEDGFILIYKLFMQLNNLKYLSNLFLEVDHVQDKQFIETKYPELLRQWNMRFIKDENELNRYIIAARELC